MSGDKKLPFPFKIEDISEEQKEARRKMYVGPQSLMVNMVRTVPRGILMPKRYESLAEEIYNMEVRPDDVWMITYPKAGSTWTQEMLWQLANGLDLERAKEMIFLRSPFLEITALCKDGTGAVQSMDAKSDGPQNVMDQLFNDSVGHVKRLPTSSPRIIKTHLPPSHLPPSLLDKAKVVWVCRNPRDSLVSWYHHEKLLPVHGLKQDCLDEYVPFYIQDNALYGDYWTHLKEAWELRDHPNVHVMWYEDMKKDLRSVLDKCSNFLGYDFPKDKIDALLDHLSFGRMRNNDAVNMKPPKGAVPDEVRDKINFIRKGTVGGWKEDFEGHDSAKQELEAWIEKNAPSVNVEIPYDV